MGDVNTEEDERSPAAGDKLIADRPMAPEILSFECPDLEVSNVGREINMSGGTVGGAIICQEAKRKWLTGK